MGVNELSLILKRHHWLNDSRWSPWATINNNYVACVFCGIERHDCSPYEHHKDCEYLAAEAIAFPVEDVPRKWVSGGSD
jgi:hypothetical protein